MDIMVSILIYGHMFFFQKKLCGIYGVCLSPILVTAYL